MTRDEFTKYVTTLVERYIENFDSFDSNPQLKIIPATLNTTIVNGSEMFKDIEYSDEVIENGANTDDPQIEDVQDDQARRNPEFYAVKKLIKKEADHHASPDAKAIAEVIDIYFK